MFWRTSRKLEGGTTLILTPCFGSTRTSRLTASTHGTSIRKFRPRNPISIAMPTSSTTRSSITPFSSKNKDNVTTIKPAIKRWFHRLFSRSATTQPMVGPITGSVDRAPALPLPLGLDPSPSDAISEMRVAPDFRNPSQLQLLAELGYLSLATFERPSSCVESSPFFASGSSASASSSSVVPDVPSLPPSPASSGASSSPDASLDNDTWTTSPSLPVFSASSSSPSEESTSSDFSAPTSSSASFDSSTTSFDGETSSFDGGSSND